MLNLKNPAERAEWIYGQPMAPCPACGSYNMKPQMPVKIGLADDDTAMQALGKLALGGKACAAHTLSHSWRSDPPFRSGAAT